MTTPINLEVTRGDDEEFTITVRNKATGLVYDLTGATCFFTIKNFQTDADASAIWKTEWTSHLDATNGKTVLTIPNTVTDDLVPRDYLYDFQIKTASGKIKTAARGILTVEEDITLRIVGA